MTDKGNSIISAKSSDAADFETSLVGVHKIQKRQNLKIINNVSLEVGNIFILF